MQHCLRSVLSTKARCCYPTIPHHQCTIQYKRCHIFCSCRYTSFSHHSPSPLGTGLKFHTRLISNVAFLSEYTKAHSCSKGLKYFEYNILNMPQVEYWLPMTLCRWYEVNIPCLHCLCTCTVQYNATQLPLTKVLVHFRAQHMCMTWGRPLVLQIML